MYIGRQLKQIMREQRIDPNELSARIDRIDGRITPGRIATLLMNLPAQEHEVELIATALGVPPWELTEQLNRSQLKTKEAFREYLDKVGCSHLFSKLWRELSQYVQYRGATDKPLDERHFRDFLNLHMNNPQEFDEENGS